MNNLRSFLFLYLFSLSAISLASKPVYIQPVEYQSAFLHKTKGFVNFTLPGKFYFEGLPGAAYILPGRMHIQQDGYRDISFIAAYKTKSFKLPIYYSLRSGFYIRNKVSIEIELNHLKVILDNNPSEIQKFELTHGYNALWINILKEFKYLDLRAGTGPVFAHPENTIRQIRLNEKGGIFNSGYYIHGISAQIAVQKKIRLMDFFFLTAETKFSASYCKTFVANGYASLPVFSVHALLGFGINL